MIILANLQSNASAVVHIPLKFYFSSKPGNNGKLKKSRDKDAGLGYDSYKKIYVYGYKIHIILDVETGLPIGLCVTKANYGENRTLVPFVNLIHQRYTMISVEEFLGDSAYDSNQGRLSIIKVLSATPYIELNSRNCKGNTQKEKEERRKKLCEKFYQKNFIQEYWVDPDSEQFDKKSDARTISEQGFSISKGLLGLDRFRHRGIVWATMHTVLVCMSMVAVANTAVAGGRPELMRCVKCFNS